MSGGTVNELPTKLIVRHVRRPRRCHLPRPLLRASAQQHIEAETFLATSQTEIDVDTEVEPSDQHRNQYLVISTALGYGWKHDGEGVRQGAK